MLSHAARVLFRFSFRAFRLLLLRLFPLLSMSNSDVIFLKYSQKVDFKHAHLY